MGFRVYAKAGTMRVNPFRDGDADTAQVTLERVIYPLPNIVLCRARLYPHGRYREDIGEDVWVACSGTPVLGMLYAYREGVSDKWYADAWYVDEDEISYWNREGYQMMAYKASMGNKKAKKMFDDFNSCEIPFIRIMKIGNKDDIFEINEVLDCCAD